MPSGCLVMWQWAEKRRHCKGCRGGDESPGQGAPWGWTEGARPGAGALAMNQAQVCPPGWAHWGVERAAPHCTAPARLLIHPAGTQQVPAGEGQADLGPGPLHPGRIWTERYSRWALCQPFFFAIRLRARQSRSWMVALAPAASHVLTEAGCFPDLM